MKALIHKIFSSVMAFVLLFSTVSFTVEKHFCGDSLVDVSVFTRAESCGMDMQASDDSSDCSFDRKACCSDKQELLKGQDTMEKVHMNLSTEQLVCLQAFVYSYIDLFEGLENNVIPYRHYSPPLLVRDIPVFNATFLI